MNWGSSSKACKCAASCYCLRRLSCMRPSTSRTSGLHRRGCVVMDSMMDAAGSASCRNGCRIGIRTMAAKADGLCIFQVLGSACDRCIGNNICHRQGFENSFHNRQADDFSSSSRIVPIVALTTCSAPIFRISAFAAADAPKIIIGFLPLRMGCCQTYHKNAPLFQINKSMKTLWKSSAGRICPIIPLCFLRKHDRLFQKGPLQSPSH